MKPPQKRYEDAFESKMYIFAIKISLGHFEPTLQVPFKEITAFHCINEIPFVVKCQALNRVFIVFLQAEKIPHHHIKL